jgi:nitroreductase
VEVATVRRSATDTFRLGVRYAVLAPSSHNTQPWRFRIDDETLSLYADRSRELPIVDPDGRELVISCGAALFNLELALAHFDREAEVVHLPDSGDPDLLARVELGEERAPTSGEEALFAAISDRHTNRQRFHARALPEGLVAALQAASALERAWFAPIVDEERKVAAGDLIAEGDRLQFRDRSFRRELAAWIVPNGSPRQDGIPGHALGFGDLSSRVAPAGIRAFNLGRFQAAKDRELATSSPLLGIIGTEGDEPSDWLAAGRALERVLLRVSSVGASASFVNQPIEVTELRPRVRELAGAGGFPQLLLRLGFAPGAVATPRRPMRDVLDTKS